MSPSDAQRDTGLDRVRWIGVADAAALRQAACRRILDAAASAIERRGRFLIVLAGGNTPRRRQTRIRKALASERTPPPRVTCGQILAIDSPPPSPLPVSCSPARNAVV
jgi:hypothetical protein